MRSNAVDPGWVPTRMGGPGATDDLALGHDTQVWLATSDDPAANTTGQYWYHRRTQPPAPAVHDTTFQDALLDKLTGITGERLPGPARNMYGAIRPPDGPGSGPDAVTLVTRVLEHRRRRRTHAS